jgi:hypothetical protein
LIESCNASFITTSKSTLTSASSATKKSHAWDSHSHQKVSNLAKNKLKAIKDAKPPTDEKTIPSFVGPCNFFRTHIKNFAIIVAALY